MRIALACEFCGAVFYADHEDAKCPCQGGGYVSVGFDVRPDADPRPPRIIGWVGRPRRPACVLAVGERPDGVRVHTVDLLPTYIIPGSTIDSCELLRDMGGRYETVVGDDYEHMYRRKTWQQAFELHELLVQPGLHELIAEARDELHRERGLIE